jgi:CBS domain-containing protein/mannitol/fructose-specific phosphotransferase system IIA component (Ntr-type)
MQLIELLPREHIVSPLKSGTLRAALGELVAALTATGVVRDPEAIQRGLDGPRSRDVVAVGRDVVLPHYRTSSVDDLQVALGLAPDGLDARDMGLEARPRVVVLILAPTEAATLYLQTVAALARLFREPRAIDRIVAAGSPDAVIEAAGLAGMRLQPRLTVRDIMIHGVSSVTPATTVRDAVDLMLRRRLRAIPVVGEKIEVLGIISEWDIMRGLLPQIPRAGQEAGTDNVPDTLRVKDIMTRSVLCISEELGLEEAANMMINKDVEQFPVTSEGKLTGFLTRSDIIRKLFGR